MCDGPIIAPAGKKMVEAKSSFSLTKVFKRFWERITCSAVNSDQPQVNMCLKCGDLEIYGMWLKIPHPQKTTISGAIRSGEITISGFLKRCDFCRLVKKENKKKIRNLRKDEIPQLSSMSF